MGFRITSNKNSLRKPWFMTTPGGVDGGVTRLRLLGEGSCATGSGELAVSLLIDGLPQYSGTLDSRQRHVW